MAVNSAALASAQQTEKELSLIPFSSPELAWAKVAAADATQKISVIPEPIKNVQFYGAKGDGINDDTAAFNKAAASGSIIVDQPGIYLLDPVVRVTIGVDLTTMRVNQTPGAVKFLAKTNAAPKYRIFNVNASDCEIDLGGAYLIGDRDTHKWVSTGDATATHEWGYCFFLGGARNRLYGNGQGHITGATGDGLGVTGPDHEVFGLVLEGNRRQGCSAFNAPRLKFHHNICRDTGNRGQPDPAPKTLIGPFCGLDIEPDQGDCLNVDIWGNTFGPNNRSGAIFWVNSRAGVVKLSGKFHDNTVTGNSNGNWLNDEVQGRYNITFEFLRNRYINNKNHDIRCDQGSIVVIGNLTQADANVFDDFNERVDRFRKGIVSPEIGVYRGAKVTAGENAYV